MLFRDKSMVSVAAALCVCSTRASSISWYYTNPLLEGPAETPARPQSGSGLQQHYVLAVVPQLQAADSVEVNNRRAVDATKGAML